LLMTVKAMAEATANLTAKAMAKMTAMVMA
jgi:hypothetical protein